MYNSIVISSGHGKYVRGASDLPDGLDEVDEARKIVEHLADELRARDCQVVTFHDDVSTSQSENLDRIVDFHNSKSRQLDISVHLNAYEHTEKPMGCEVLYYSDSTLANQLSAAIADVGFINRGGKQRTDLAFLRNTTESAVLLEVLFCDSMADCEIYRQQFDAICENLAAVLAGEEGESVVPPTPPDNLTIGRVSEFGGAADTGMTESEPLAFIYKIGDKPELFLPGKNLDAEALGHDLNPYVHYLAMRWDYEMHSKQSLLNKLALVRNPLTGFALTAMPSDWGPNVNTNRVADLSPSLMADLGLVTDDIAEIVFPYEPEETT